ncbi:MAG: response regulator [Sulfurimonas sp.]|nr:response regulator [Sulfurimonas sp.]
MQDTAESLETYKYLQNLTLLCVEGDKTTQLLYTSIFQDLVKEIVFAQDGHSGYESFKDINRDIDILISDYSMPIMNGLEMIKNIRQIDKIIPIIFVSAIEDVQTIVQALSLEVNYFIQKPIQSHEIIKALENCAKLLIANATLKKQKEKSLYHSYQEDIGFAKELNILRNDFYYQMIDGDTTVLVDFLYQPLDVLSGDAYCARCIAPLNSFYLMVDGMGKGLSASLTAMIMTSFVNHIIDKMLQTDSFDLAVLIHETMEYIKPILLDEEALAIDYIHIDDEEKTLYYAKFAMPVLLMENQESKIIRLKSNNGPLSKWQDTFNIDSYDISDIKKFLIYSDGIVENTTIHKQRPYADFIEEDFLHSFTREDLKESFFNKIDTQEDDLSLIYIHKLIPSSIDLGDESFPTNLESLDKANTWYEDIWRGTTLDETLSYRASLVFTELYMNAYEHGNLAIDSTLKHNLMDEDAYFESLQEKELLCDKKIWVKVTKVKHNSFVYIVTQITDEGMGFDTQILSEIFRNSVAFNGRGVFVSRKNSLGIYYNRKGTSVLYLNKV